MTFDRAESAPSGAYNGCAVCRKTIAAGGIHFRRGCLITGAPAEWHIPWGADMQVFSRNDGPVTILFDTDA